jgi:hypothetical protein
VCARVCVCVGVRACMRVCEGGGEVGGERKGGEGNLEPEDCMRCTTALQKFSGSQRPSQFSMETHHR